MPISFKQARLSDQKLILNFIREYYDYDDLKFHPRKARNALIPLLKNPSLGRVWFILNHKIPVGYVLITFGFILEFHGRHVVIDEIYIRKEHRRRGLGRKAIHWVQKFCKAQRIHTIRLEVEKKNRSAFRAYQKTGFVAHERLLMTKRFKSR